MVACDVLFRVGESTLNVCPGCLCSIYIERGEVAWDGYLIQNVIFGPGWLWSRVMFCSG